MIFKESHLQGNYLIDLELRSDERGFFARYFCENEFQKHGLNTRWVQINNSMSKQAGTLRGLHFQRTPYSEVKLVLQRTPYSEVKLVRCIKGSIWDVVVDLRKESATFGKWFGSTLSEKNRTMMYVSEGFAHGFISLEENSEIIYLVSNTYTPSAEGTLIWNDPEVAIEWPMEPVVISEKDMIGDSLKNISHIE